MGKAYHSMHTERTASFTTEKFPMRVISSRTRPLRRFSTLGTRLQMNEVFGDPLVLVLRSSGHQDQPAKNQPHLLDGKDASLEKRAH